MSTPSTSVTVAVTIATTSMICIRKAAGARSRGPRSELNELMNGIQRRIFDGFLF